jgi:hypothetical protein
MFQIRRYKMPVRDVPKSTKIPQMVGRTDSASKIDHVVVEASLPNLKDFGRAAAQFLTGDVAGAKASMKPKMKMSGCAKDGELVMGMSGQFDSMKLHVR